jgi:hypothetical protein
MLKTMEVMFMSIATSISKIGLGNSIDFNQTAAKTRFLGAVSENVARAVQKPVLIAAADTCSAANIHLSFVNAKRLHEQLKALRNERSKVYEEADALVADSSLCEELLEKARVIYRQIRDLLRTENANGLTNELDKILRHCHNLPPDERRALEDLRSKLHGWINFIKPNNKVNSKPKIAPKKTPTPAKQRIPAPQMPQFSIPPDLLPFLFRIITGSEQRA